MQVQTVGDALKGKFPLLSFCNQQILDSEWQPTLTLWDFEHTEKVKWLGHLPYYYVHASHVRVYDKIAMIKPQAIFVACEF